MQRNKPSVILPLLLLILGLGAEWLRAEESIEKKGPVVPHRGSASAVALSDEQILIVGGNYYASTRPVWIPVTTAEIFDIETQRFMPAGSTQSFYYQPTLLTLNDGRILVSGPHLVHPDGPEQSDTYSPEIYDPDTNAWSLLEKIQLDKSETIYANRLYDGRILFLAFSDTRVFGSKRKDAQMFRAWLYDSERETAEAFSPQLSPRTGSFPVILPSGDVLVTGGAIATFQPEHLCEQVPPEYAIEAGEPSGDWCAGHGAWMSACYASSTEVWNVFWDDVSVYDQLPFEGASDLYTQFLDNGDVLALTRVDSSRRRQKPRSAAVWSMETEQWTRLDDFPEYFHLNFNNDLFEQDDGVLIGPSGGYSPVSGQWDPFPRSLWTGLMVELPSGAIGFLKPSEPYWTELDAVSTESTGTAD